MKQRIKTEAHRLGACACGIVKAEVFSDLGSVLGKSAKIPMVSASLQERINPFLILPNATSIVVCLFPYYVAGKPQEDGTISRYARGLDYHSVVKEKLERLARFPEASGYQAVCFADNGPLNDRYLAWRAGLGFFGKNGCLIHPEYGSYTFVGYLVTDCPMEEDTPIEETCMACGACMRACPGRALSEDGFLAEQCVSYLTQKKGELTPKEVEAVRKSGFVWGCDVCQEVCPHNQGIKETTIPEFREDLICTLQLGDEMSNRAFRHKYQKRAFAWRGKAPLIRNLQILKKE